MTGTQNHEGIAGAINAVLYLASLGSTDHLQPLRSRLELAYNMIEKHEASLAQRFLEKIWANNSYKVLGYSEPTFKNNKVSTFSIQCLSKNPRSVAQELANRNIFAYSGNFYAKSLLETLGLDQAGGVLRIGFVHYNTLEEVDQTIEALAEISGR
jgi:selenocysteine lyase/cysteine desulfurase